MARRGCDASSRPIRRSTVSCTGLLPIKGVNGKFTQRLKMIIKGLFKLFWVYIRHQKRDQPILKLTHMF